jgi:dihydroflavonol-4-reductase
VNLVTGATGILGANLIWQLLLQNKTVVAVKRKKSNLNQVNELFKIYDNINYNTYFEKIKWIELDLFDVYGVEEAINQNNIKVVYHCAGFVSFFDNDKDALFKINEEITANLVNICLNFPGIFLCHVSSIATINNLDYKVDLNEDVFWKTSGKESYYAISKYKGENQVWRGIEEGLNAVIVNPGVILSAGFKNQSSNKIIDYCLKNGKFYTNGKSAYVLASDVAKCMIMLIENKVFGQRFIICENNYSHKEIFHFIQTHLNFKKASFELKYYQVYCVYLLGKLLKLFLIKKQVLSKATTTSIFNIQKYSNAKITNELNFKFTPINEAVKLILNHNSTKINNF